MADGGLLTRKHEGKRKTFSDDLVESGERTDRTVDRPEINAGGHLMQRGDVDLVIVGSDRTTRTGDVANKIGTYLKALAAFDNKIPFYVALPSTSFDWTIGDGAEIPIEERGAEEVKRAEGWSDGELLEVSVAPENSPAANYGFDVTPRRLVTGLITERGVCQANEKSILGLFPERA